MKVQHIAPHIYRLYIFFIIPITVWVVVDEDGVVLVDTGLGTMAKGILRFIDGLGKGPLKYILLTHGHVDHVGSVEKILKNRTVPVYVHEVEAPYMEGSVAYPQRKAKVFLPAGVAEKVSLAADGSVVPASGRGAAFSLSGYLTPGHSPGHVAYYHKQDNVLLAGDLFWSKNGTLLLPKFSYDNELAVESSRIVDRLQPKIVDCCHGWPVENPAEQIGEYRAQNAGGTR